MESGDVLIMSGESRLFYHGVPRILPAMSQVWNSKNDSDLKINNKHFIKEIVDKLSDDVEWESFNSYINRARINMNVRQVLLPGQSKLCD